MAKRTGKTSEPEVNQEQEKQYDYTRFILRDKKLSDGTYHSPLRPDIKKDGSKDWILNVKVPEDVSPTGYMNVTMPTGKLSSDPEGKKNLFFKIPHKDKEGNPVEHVNVYYIANEVGKLNAVAAGRKDQEGTNTKISISPKDLKEAIIKQSKADLDAYTESKKSREVPETPHTETEAENEGASM